MLFDHAIDPGENVDLAKMVPDEASRLRAVLEDAANALDYAEFDDRTPFSEHEITAFELAVRFNTTYEEIAAELSEMKARGPVWD